MTLIHQSSALAAAVASYPLVLVVIPLAVLAISTLVSYRKLSHIPGPFFARYTNFPRLSWVLSNRAHDIHTSLHRKYGPLVRFGPNMVSCADPEEISNIYTFVKPWSKASTVMD